MVAVLWFIRMLLATVLAGAAASKVRPAARAELASALGNAGLVPRALQPVVATGLLIAEGLTALLLTSGTELGLAGAALVFAALTAGVVAIIVRRRTVTCRCFGGHGSQVGTAHAVRNGVLLGLALVGLVITPRVTATDPEAWAVFGAGSGLIVGAAIVTWHDITYLLSARQSRLVTTGGSL